MPFQARDISIPPVPDWLQRGAGAITQYIPDIFAPGDPYLPGTMLLPEYMKDWAQGETVDPSEMMYEGLTNQMGGGQPLAQFAEKRAYERVIDKFTNKYWRKYNPYVATAPKDVEDIIPLVVRFPKEGPLPRGAISNITGMWNEPEAAGVLLTMPAFAKRRKAIDKSALIKEGNIILTAGRSPSPLTHETTHYLNSLLGMPTQRYQPGKNIRDATLDFWMRSGMPTSDTAMNAFTSLIEELPKQYPELARSINRSWPRGYAETSSRIADEMLASFMERKPQWWGNPIAALEENPWLYSQRAYQALADMLSEHRYVPREAFRFPK